MKITITEALAELKTITARCAKKREFIRGCLGRQEAYRDPHEKDGGSRAVIQRERQALNDLLMRTVTIRSAIQQANRENSITIGKSTMTIHDWLVWRREVAPGHRAFLAQLRADIDRVRQQAQTKGVQVNPAEAKPQDVIINVDELALAQEAETLEETLGILDGQLSLKNATVIIDV